METAGAGGDCDPCVKALELVVYSVRAALQHGAVPQLCSASLFDRMKWETH